MRPIAPHSDNTDPRRPNGFQADFLGCFPSGISAIIWAELHAPELLNPPADDPIAAERLIRRWLEASGSDPSPLLIEAVDANNPSMVETLLPANPSAMGHALLLAMTNANCLTQECYDFCIYRGCITDYIRGKGLPDSYFEIAESIAMLLRNHGARDFTHLPKAARNGDLEKMRHEIEGGTPLDFTCDGWGSPLLSAVAAGQLEAVEYLLDLGADPNLGFDPGILQSPPSDYLELPLVAATRQESPAILKALLRAGADLHARQMEKSRLFESGALSREVAEILFESPMPLLRNHEGDTCAHLLDADSLRRCQDLIPAAAWDARNKGGETPLMSHMNRRSPITNFLLTAGSSPNEYSNLCTFPWSHSLPTEYRMIALTPIHAAIITYDCALIELLLDAGGDFDLPAFTLANHPSMESCQRLRDALDAFQPANFPQWRRDPWRESFEEQQEWNLRFHGKTYPPVFSGDELSLLSHYLAEDPSRASRHQEVITPVSCLDLARLSESPVVIETVRAGSKMAAVSFFSHMREEIDLRIAEYKQTLRDLDDPDIGKPLVYPYMEEMRKLELAILHRIWEETGTVPVTSITRDAAMACLRFANDEFFGGFATALGHVENSGKASMEDLGSILAENLNPGSTIDLGKFFTGAIAELKRLKDLCR